MRLSNIDYSDDGLNDVDEMALLRNDALTDAERQKMFATKSQAFSHEEECRIVVQPSVKPNSAWHGHGLYRHASGAVREIVFGERVSEQNRQAIMQMMADRDVTFWNAVRERNRFKIRIDRATTVETPASELAERCRFA